MIYNQLIENEIQLTTKAVLVCATNEYSVRWLFIQLK